MDLQIKRHLTQFCAAILYNSKFFSSNATSFIRADKVCVPGLNCQYCPGAVAGCPLGTLQSIFGGGFLRLPFYMLASIVLFALLLGRIICGWLCPFGFFFDLLYKIPSPKLKKNSLTAKLCYVKYLIFAIAVVLIPLYMFYSKGMTFPAFCEELCPNGLLNAVFMMVTNTGFAFLYSNTKLIIALAIISASIVIYRPFCRFICPLGAFYAVFNKLSIFAIQIDESKCIGCNACQRTCLMDCQKVGDTECIACGKCKAVCPTKAINIGIRSCYCSTKKQ